MHLAKHQTGHPLTPAELKQRRDAAHARWAAVVGATAAGAIVGGSVAAVRQARAAPRQMADALAVHQHAFDARAQARHRDIETAINRRMRGTPDPLKPEVPVIGTPTGKPPKIYDYQIAALQRRLKGISDPAQVADVNSLLARLHRLAGHAPQPTARAPTRRVRNRAKLERDLKNAEQAIKDMEELHGITPDLIGMDLHQADLEANLSQAHPVNAHVMRAYRGGETAKQIRDRITGARGNLRERQRVLEAAFTQRTTKLAASTRARVVSEMEMLLHQRMLRTGAKGAAIGAAIGLTAAGISLLTKHVLDARKSRKLAKAASDDKTPEQSMAAGMAETYRAWIDRLLGNNHTPIRMADDLINALGPGLTQAFAEGATQPPQAESEGELPYKINVDFDVINPAVRRHMATYALDRIVEISNQQREAIRQTLLRQSVMQGIGPREVARSLRESIGLTAYQTNVVNGFRRKLEELDPGVFEMKLRDKRYDRTIANAIRDDKPLTPDQINAMVEAYHRRMLALRAETIARTEAIRSTSYGAVARAQDVLDDNPQLDVIKHWIATDDDRTRDSHRELNGKEVQGMQTPFITIHDNKLRWPVDQEGVADECVNCRCALGFRFIPKAGSLQAISA